MSAQSKPILTVHRPEAFHQSRPMIPVRPILRTEELKQRIVALGRTEALDGEARRHIAQTQTDDEERANGIRLE